MTLGLIYTGERMDELQQLTTHRAVAALPIVRRYRLIDFMLSSMVALGHPECRHHHAEELPQPDGPPGLRARSGTCTASVTV